MNKDTATNITFPLAISKSNIIAFYLSYSAKVLNWCIAITYTAVNIIGIRTSRGKTLSVGSGAIWRFGVSLEPPYVVMEHLGGKREIRAHPPSSSANCFSMSNITVLSCCFLWILYSPTSAWGWSLRSVPALAVRLYTHLLMGRTFWLVLNCFK